MSSYFVVFRHQFECQWTCTSAVSAHAGHSIQGPYRVYIGSTVFQKDYTQFTKVHALLTGSHWISLDFTSPCCLSHSLPFSACVQSTLLELRANFHQRQEVLSMLRACSPLRIKSIKHQNEELQPKDANGGHRNRDARCKICSLSLSSMKLQGKHKQTSVI